MSVSEIPRGNRSAVELSPTGDELKQAMKIKAARARKTLQDQTHRYAEAARERAEVARRRTSETVQEHPFASVATATGFGMVAGFALGVCAGLAAERWMRSARVAAGGPVV